MCALFELQRAVRAGPVLDVENDHEMPGFVDLEEYVPVTTEPDTVDTGQGIAKWLADPAGVLEQRSGDKSSSSDGHLWRQLVGKSPPRRHRGMRPGALGLGYGGAMSHRRRAAIVCGDGVARA